MKLKKLTINGFKSFADKVAIDFDFEVIAIVGPNGCGKSNIVDAFRWVMGEQSAKSLRGDRMNDVLFAGSDQRKALNYAEVSILLSDVADELPLPYDEVNITRRLYRSGESEYYINKEPVRLRDIQGLLLGSGLGKNAFSIFEQGKLDQVIHLSPLERRAIFDEAAGTSRFLQRKKESVRKLLAVADNLARVSDLHTEIEKQARQLKKQAHQARSYQDNKARLEELEKGVLVHRRHLLAQDEIGLTEEEAQLTRAIETAQLHLHRLEEAYQKAKEHLLYEEKTSKECQKEFNQCETQLRVIESEINQNKFRILEFKKRQQNQETQLQDSLKEEARLNVAIAQGTDILKAATEKKQQLEKETTEQKKRVLQREGHLAALSQDLKKRQEAHLNSVREESRLNAQLQHRTSRYESKLSRLAKLKESEERYRDDLRLLQVKIEEYQQKVKTLSGQIDLVKLDHEMAEKHLQSLRKEQLEGQKERESFLRTINELEGQKKALVRLKEDMEGFSESAKLLLKEAKNKKSPLFQKLEPLFEYLIPVKGFEQLVASSMRSYAETLVVATEDDFISVIAYAKQKKIADFSLIVKSKIPKLQSNISKQTINLTQTNPLAYHMTGHLEITEDKHFFDSLGVYFHVGTGKKFDNAFIRQAELLALEETLQQLEERDRQLISKNQQVAETLKHAEKKRSECFETLRKKEMDLVQENFHLHRFIADRERSQKELDLIEHEKSSLNTILDDEKTLLSLQQEHSSIQHQVEGMFQSVKESEILIEAEKSLCTKERQLGQSLETSFQEAKLHAQKCDQENKIVQAKLHYIVEQKVKLAHESEELKAALEKLVGTLSIQEKENGLVIHTLAALQKRVKAQEDQLHHVKKQGELVEKELVQQRKIVVGPDKERHAVELSLAKVLSEKKGIEEELMNRYGFSSLASIAAHLRLELSMEEAMQEIQQLRLALAGAGSINLTAIEEFQSTQDRFDFLDKQLKDLEESKKDLEGIIAKLDQESRKLFKKTFHQIRENFQKNFAILFSGGSADITFTESSDILEAGIEIVAKPPGKQMKALSLLSGGEKCLTALALLFSIFEVRPAPFCILDEVDAPLDDSNIDRFTQMLKQFVDKTQFIIVTHNKKTMAMAGLLIGVSMEEKGISKLISLSFEKSVKEATC